MGGARPSLTSRSADLHRNPDGSLDLVLAAAPPDEPTANWLATPAGPFSLVMRVYSPRDDGAPTGQILPAILPPRDGGVTVRPSLVCGVLLAVAAVVSGAFMIVTTPSRAMDALRDRLTACALPGLRCAPPGVFLHQRTIGAPPDPALGLPDPDTLVSSAWVRADGPWHLDIPAIESRFFAVQVLDGRDAPVALADSRTFGVNGGSLQLPSGARSSDWMWIVARIAVDGEADVPAVHALQNALRVVREP